MVQGLKFKNKKAAAFGSYGWSGESVKLLNESLKNAGFEVINDGIRTLWVPDANEADKLKNFGKEFADIINIILTYF